MFQVITRNSVYTVVPNGSGFRVSRTADLYGREVRDKHEHETRWLTLAVGSAMVTDGLTTSLVRAIVPVPAR